jgi:hypothetical protein
MNSRTTDRRQYRQAEFVMKKPNACLFVLQLRPELDH